MNAIREWMDKPLSTTEIIIILAVLVFLLFLIIQIDKWRTHRKSKKFIRRHPDAALILLAAEDRPVSRAVLNVLEGEASSPFPVPASQRPDGKRGLAFYAAPGPVSVNLMLSHAKDSDGRSSTANRLSLTAEANASYLALLDNMGHIRLSLLKGNNPNFQASQEPSKSETEPKHTYPNTQPRFTNPVMNYCIQEEKRIIICCFLLLFPLGYLAGIRALPWFSFLIPVALFFVAILRAFFMGSRPFRQTLEKLPDQRKEKIWLSFARPHPIYKLFSGDVHLFPDCLICRYGGKLFLIPMESITSAQTMRGKQALYFVTTLVIQTDTGRRHSLEFSGRHQDELSPVLSWIREHNPNIVVSD